MGVVSLCIYCQLPNWKTSRSAYDLHRKFGSEMATESSRKMDGENPSLSANDLKLTAFQESLSLRDLGLWPTSLPACGGALQMKTKNQRSSERDADFLFSFAEREGFELNSQQPLHTPN